VEMNRTSIRSGCPSGIAWRLGAAPETRVIFWRPGCYVGVSVGVLKCRKPGFDTFQFDTPLAEYSG
jgi:hypothetical protein